MAYNLYTRMCLGIHNRAFALSPWQGFLLRVKQYPEKKIAADLRSRQVSSIIGAVRFLMSRFNGLPVKT